MSTTFETPPGASEKAVPLVPTSANRAEKPPTKRISVPQLLSQKGGPAIVCLTAYDYTTAALLDSTSAVDLVLVGDSLSGIVQGLETTLPVTLEEMIYHCRCVTRGVRRALVVADMPFMTYQISPEQAMNSAARLIKEGGAAAAKLEGGAEIAPSVARLVAAGIPVMGHVGLTPQSFHTLGGHVRQGKTQQQREKIIADATVLAEAGAFSIVLECIPADLAAQVTQAVKCPTIGIGSGDYCDGQILVINDLVGLRIGAPPPFVQQEASLAAELTGAVKRFASRVQTNQKSVHAAANVS